jgi:MATE family multidrug resistance protein
MRFILLTTVVMSPVPVILAWLGTDLLGLGLYWCWTMVTLWVTGLGVIYMSRFLQGRWRDMRVIEPGLPEADAEPLDQFEPEPVAIRT